MFRHLVLATDFSPDSLQAAQTAMALAKAFGAEVTLVHVAPVDATDAQIQERQRGLDLMKDERFGAIARVSTQLVTGARVADALVEVVERVGADLVVAGRHGEHALRERLLGTVTERLVRHLSCSILTIHPSHRGPLVLLKHVLAATDFSAASAPAISAAGQIAKAFDAWVTLMHVYDLVPAAMELLEEPYRKGEDHSLAKLALAKLDQSRKELLDGVPAEVKLERDKSTVAAICDYASLNGADLVVVGSQGRTGLARFLLGSVAERVVRHAACSVLVVRRA